MAISCGVPVEPEITGWAVVAILLPEYGGIYNISEGGKRIYLTLRKGDAIVIGYFYGFYDIVEEYTLPYYYYDAEILDIVFYDYGNKGWAVGGKRAGYEAVPLILRYDYYNDSGPGSVGYWEEVLIEDPPEGAITAIYPINEEETWVLIDGSFSSYGASPRGLLAKFNGSSFDVVEEFGKVTTAYYYARKTGDHIIYAVEFTRERTPRVYISGDRGASWREELLEFENPGGYEIEKAWAALAVRGDLYIIIDFKEENFMGIVKRSGSAGPGTYELEFLSNYSPFFYNIKRLVANGQYETDEPPVTAVAVGEKTSVYFDGAEWRVEKLFYPDNFRDLVTAAGYGYYALSGGASIYYHR